MSWTIRYHSEPVIVEGSVVGRDAVDGSTYRTYCDDDNRWFCKISLFMRKPFIDGPFKNRIGAAKRGARHIYDHLVSGGWIP